MFSVGCMTRSGSFGFRGIMAAGAWFYARSMLTEYRRFPRGRTRVSDMARPKPGIANIAGVFAGTFKLMEVFEGAVELALESGEITAEEVESGAGIGGSFPGGAEGSDVVHGFELPLGGVRMDGHLDIEKRGFHHGETFEAPIDIGDLLDEAKLGFSGGAEVVEPSLFDFEAEVLGFIGEHGVDGGGESVFESVAGGLGLAFEGVGSF